MTERPRLTIRTIITATAWILRHGSIGLRVALIGSTFFFIYGIVSLAIPMSVPVIVASSASMILFFSWALWYLTRYALRLKKIEARINANDAEEQAILRAAAALRKQAPPT